MSVSTSRPTAVSRRSFASGLSGCASCSASGTTLVSRRLRAAEGRSLHSATFPRRSCSQGRLTLRHVCGSPEPARKKPGSGHGGRELGDCSRPPLLSSDTEQGAGRQRPRREAAVRRHLAQGEARRPAQRRIAPTERRRREGVRAMEASTKTKPKPAKRSKPKAGLESFNPATGELLGSVETLTPSKVQGVVDDVAEVQPFWAALTLEDRARYMRRASDALLEDMDEIAELLTNEQGKPRVESYTMELLPTVDSLNWIADNGPEILSDEKLSMPLFLKSKSAKFTYEPIGVVGVIAPWNYPWSIPFGEVAIALMAGNGVVLKPASLTPLIGEPIPPTVEKAGLPEGIVRDVHGGGKVGQALAESSAGKIFFTGPGVVGRKGGEICGKSLKSSG